MTYRIKFSGRARRALKGLEPTVLVRVLAAVTELAEMPRPPGAKLLRGKPDLWRIRVGDWRVVYTIHDDRLLVLVVRIGHRREVYR